MPCDLYILRPRFWIFSPQADVFLNNPRQWQIGFDFLQFYSYAFTGKTEVQIK